MEPKPLPQRPFVVVLIAVGVEDGVVRVLVVEMRVERVLSLHGDGDGMLDEHVPKRGLHPVPQHVVELPQYSIRVSRFSGLK